MRAAADARTGGASGQGRGCPTRVVQQDVQLKPRDFTPGQLHVWVPSGCLLGAFWVPAGCLLWPSNCCDAAWALRTMACRHSFAKGFSHDHPSNHAKPIIQHEFLRVSVTFHPGLIPSSNL